MPGAPRATMVANVLLVALGGALGAVLRWSIAPPADATGWPHGTLVVNLLGSLLLGVVAVLLAASVMSREQALLVGTGLLGAFTTMSTYALELVRLSEEGAWSLAAAYFLVTALGCPLMAWIGWTAASSAFP
jgi:CrcB protein